MIYDLETARREEQTYRTPGAIQRRRRVREALRLEGNESVLSLGPGPGFEPLELITEGAAQSVIGIERSDAMLTLAAERCASSDQVSLAKGEATQLPLRDESVDAAVSVQVYGYVTALDDALSELERVLRPGGQAVVYVTDWETLVWRLGDDELADRVYTAWKNHCVRPRLGSELANPLRDAGFQIDDVRPYTICSTSLDGTFTGCLVPEVREQTAETLNQEIANSWYTAIQAQERAGKTFFSLTGFLYRVAKESR